MRGFTRITRFPLAAHDKHKRRIDFGNVTVQSHMAVRATSGCFALGNKSRRW